MTVSEADGLKVTASVVLAVYVVNKSRKIIVNLLTKCESLCVIANDEPLNKHRLARHLLKLLNSFTLTVRNSISDNDKKNRVFSRIHQVIYSLKGIGNITAAAITIPTLRLNKALVVGLIKILRSPLEARTEDTYRNQTISVNLKGITKRELKESLHKALTIEIEPLRTHRTRVVTDSGNSKLLTFKPLLLKGNLCSLLSLHKRNVRLIKLNLLIASLVLKLHSTQNGKVVIRLLTAKHFGCLLSKWV